jgi:DNA-binding GntR family transcriptional regulator
MEAFGAVTAGIDRPRLAVLIEHERESAATAHELVLGVLRAAVTGGVIASGTRLRQEDLAGLFGTSRIPVREGLRALEHEGLVTSVPHRGFTVTALQADDLDEIFDLRGVLESHAVRLLAPIMTEADTADLDALYGQLVAGSTDDLPEVRDRFFARLFAITGRPRLVEMIERLRREAERGWRGTSARLAGEPYGGFWLALRSGDVEVATARLATHYARVAALMRREALDQRARAGAARSRSA